VCGRPYSIRPAQLAFEAPTRPLDAVARFFFTIVNKHADFWQMTPQPPAGRHSLINGLDFLTRNVRYNLANICWAAQFSQLPPNRARGAVLLAPISLRGREMFLDRSLESRRDGEGDSWLLPMRGRNDCKPRFPEATARWLGARPPRGVGRRLLRANRRGVPFCEPPSAGRTLPRQRGGFHAGFHERCLGTHWTAYGKPRGRRNGCP
jgi:hypothetical protein